jgi:hypothetical protein
MSFTLRDLHAEGMVMWISIAGNSLLALWAFVARVAGRRTLGDYYWAAILTILAVVAVQVIAGLILLGLGARPRTSLHLIYGVSIAIVALAQYELRPRGWIRRRLIASGVFSETSAMALVCLTQAGLLMRAWMTGVAGR